MQFLRRIPLYIDQIRYADDDTEWFAELHMAFFARMLADLPGYGMDGPSGKRVLDLGCGKLYWLALLLHNAGARVTGLDIEHVAPGRSPAKYWRVLRANGFERAAKTFYWDVRYGGRYYRALEARAGRALSHRDLDLCRASVLDMPFDDATFDLVVSYESMEHFPDLPAAVHEIARVMKPGALTYIYVHNYASVSGGHHIAWKHPDTKPSDTVPPWDHLRANRFPEIPSWINRQREHVYRALFEREFDVLGWETYATEGQALLTPEIRAELSDYDEEELLKKGFIIIARKAS